MESILCNPRLFEWETQMERAERVHNGRGQKHKDGVSEQSWREAMDCYQRYTRS